LQFPLSLWDISLVLAVIAVVLLATSEIVSSYQGRSLAIEKKVLRRVALLFAFAFLFTVAVTVYQAISAA
jgi:uncharacterized membrane protein